EARKNGAEKAKRPQWPMIVLKSPKGWTGPLSAGWFINSFINPANDGAVLPILHVNGGKISNPTIWSRRSNEELTSYFSGSLPSTINGFQPAPEKYEV
ncbi:hypothetical protein, partial [Mycoplasmopsis bovis]|uniref:hypothetical protein n=1 Tax=Mycoplasmopsis bovis TaxID=28903 RepID=UPI003D289E0F